MLDTPLNPTQTIRERIIHLRRLLMVHSYIYYQLDDSIVSDDKWQQWANDLRDLQNLFGSQGVGYYDVDFKDWDGSSGFNLPHDLQTTNRTWWLLRVPHRFTDSPNYSEQRYQRGGDGSKH